MAQIFGDTTDDITFGNAPAPQKSNLTPEKKSISWESFSQPQSAAPIRTKTPSPAHSQHHFEPKNTKVRLLSMPEPTSIVNSLVSLIDSMKPSYLPNFSDGLVRLVALSEPSHSDPLLLVRSDDVTLIFGTGFGSIDNAWKKYVTFPDLRLISNEKDRLAGWILTREGFDISLFQTILEYLGFPYVYWTRDVIAYIRNSIKDASFLEKCRFFEILSPGMAERKIAHFTIIPTSQGMLLQSNGKTLLDTLHITLDAPQKWSLQTGILTLSKNENGFLLSDQKEPYLQWDIIDVVSSTKTIKQTLRFTFDTFYVDAQSVGILAGYTLKDRSELAQHGILTFVLEEDVRSKAIVGHIFIDSRGFVHSYEMMSVHKEVLKAIRHVYESTIIAHPRIERGELVQTLRRELTKYCYILTWRTPVVMPVIIER
jgi:Ribonuclease J C-terminal domain